MNRLTADILDAQRLQKHLDNSDFRELAKGLLSEHLSFPREMLLFWKAHLYNAMNDNTVSNWSIQELRESGVNCDDAVTIELLKLQSDNYAKLYNYREAFRVCDILVDKYSGSLEEAEREGLENFRAIWESLTDVPGQSITATGYEIPLTVEKGGYISVPVTCGSQTDDFIIDTGAGISVISAGAASRMGLELRPVKVGIATTTNHKLQTTLAVARRIKIGNVILNNVVFLVVDDHDLDFPEMDFSIKGIIGFPVLNQLGRLTFTENVLSVDLDPATKNQSIYLDSNLYMDAFCPVYRVYSGGQMLRMILDTGAQKSELSLNFLNRNRERIESEGKIIPVIRGGGGGMFPNSVYILSDFTFTDGTRRITLPEIMVLQDDYLFNRDKEGNAGMDLLSQFESFTIDFRKMRLELGKKRSNS